MHVFVQACVRVYVSMCMSMCAGVIARIRVCVPADRCVRLCVCACVCVCYPRIVHADTDTRALLARYLEAGLIVGSEWTLQMG